MNGLHKKASTAGRGIPGLLCLLALSAGPSPAAEPDAVAPEPETPARDDEPAPMHDFEAEVRRLEAERGAWDPQLGEQLLGLGLVYQEQEQHAEATEALKRAMYIRRVNEGLYDMGQVPILREIIESDVASGNWEDLDQAYEQLLFIHRRNFEPGDARFLPILDTVGAWKVRAYTEGLLKENPMTTITSAERLYKDSVKLLEKQYGETDPRLVDPLYGRAVVGYQLLRETAARPVDDFDRGNYGSVPIASTQRVCSATPTGRIVCWTVPTNQTGAYVSKYAQQQQEKDMEMRKYYSVAGDSLKRIVAIHDAHPELPAEARAQALINLGDWNMLGKKRDTAVGLYRRAYQVLATAPDSEALLEKYLGAPRSVPTLRLQVPEVDRKLDELAAQSYVIVAVDVSKRGDARNFQVVEQTDASDQGALRDAREKIKESTFRPRFENGEPVDTPGFKIRFSGVQ